MYIYIYIYIYIYTYPFLRLFQVLLDRALALREAGHDAAIIYTHIYAYIYIHMYIDV